LTAEHTPLREAIWGTAKSLGDRIAGAFTIREQIHDSLWITERTNITGAIREIMFRRTSEFYSDGVAQRREKFVLIVFKPVYHRYCGKNSFIRPWIREKLPSFPVIPARFWLLFKGRISRWNTNSYKTRVPSMKAVHFVLRRESSPDNDCRSYPNSCQFISKSFNKIIGFRWKTVPNYQIFFEIERLVFAKAIFSKRLFHLKVIEQPLVHDQRQNTISDFRIRIKKPIMTNESKFDQWEMCNFVAGKHRTLPEYWKTFSKGQVMANRPPWNMIFQFFKAALRY
jgi:hypothetical protein